MLNRLFHFSEDPSVPVFEPRCVRVAVERPAGQEWLNGPLVWSIDERHEFLYLFPRECPRVLVWPTALTTPRDYETWFGDSECNAIAFVEEDWVDRINTAPLHRYEMPTTSFENVDEVGMWVSRSAVTPIGLDSLRDLRGELGIRGVELRSLPRLTPLKSVWQTTLHASGIRTRNAQDWGKPTWAHSKPGRVVIP